MKRTVLALVVAATAACSFDIPNLNDPSLDEFRTSASRSEVSAAATGLLVGYRRTLAATNGYVVMLGILGREGYNFDTADPRFISEMLEAAALDPGSPAFGGNIWQFPYANIRNGYEVLAAVDVVADMTEEEREATRGFAKTIIAMEFLKVVVTRDVNGAPVDVNRPLEDELAPIVSKEMVYARIEMLLDEAATHLAAGGAAFPFPLGRGFTGFDTPATFLTVNRGINARVEVYQEDYAEAIASLDMSFVTTDAAVPALDLGVYNTYGTGSGDALNDLVDPNIYAHPSLVTTAPTKANGDPDARIAAKIKVVTPKTASGITTMYQFAHYDDPTDPLPIIRNEELILLRAEARANTGDLPGAIDDLNFIREESGGLAPRADLTAGNFEDELLLQRGLSLMFEGGHRWIDFRRFGRLEELPLDVPTHSRHSAYPIPTPETDARQ